MYIFSRNSHFLNIREKYVHLENYFYSSLKGVLYLNANFNTHEITHFHKSAKMYTRENIYAHSNKKKIPSDVSKLKHNSYFNFHIVLFNIDDIRSLYQRQQIIGWKLTGVIILDITPH